MGRAGGMGRLDATATPTVSGGLGFAAGAGAQRRGMAKNAKWRGGGVEGFSEEFMATIKKRFTGRIDGE